MDFFYLRDEVLPAAKAQPSAGNTLLADAMGSRGVARFSSAADIDWLESALEAVRDEPVAYLGALLLLLQGSSHGAEISVPRSSRRNLQDAAWP